MTQTADDQARAAAVQAEEDAIGELESVIGEEPDLGPPSDTATATATATKAAPPLVDAKNDTRQRILDVALDLFTEQGYDGTSLREIAEQLGVTKAALYYHFESKEDILMALHMRIHDFGREALMLIGEEPVTLELWENLLDQIVGEMLAQRKLFLMHERNQAVMEKLHREDHDAEHEDIQNSSAGSWATSGCRYGTGCAWRRPSASSSRASSSATSPSIRLPRTNWRACSATSSTTSCADDGTGPPGKNPALPGYSSSQ